MRVRGFFAVWYFVVQSFVVSLSREILALLDTLRLLCFPDREGCGRGGFQVGTLYWLDFMSVTYHISS